MTKWIEIKTQCNAIESETIEEALEDLSAMSIAMTPSDQNERLFEEHPGQDAGLWEEMEIIAYFSAEVDAKSIIDQLKNALPKLNLDWSWESITDDSWQTRWQEQFQPIQISQRLWICPSWQTSPDPNAINLILDPGLAFGTGSHPTTAMCLGFLEKHVQASAELIDYGCGSGILALAALKLGASKAMAVDIDPVALEVTKENALLNAIDLSRLETCLHGEVAPNIQFDLVVANILANPLCELAPILCALLKPQAKMALAGLLVNQADQVITTYQNHGISLQIAEQREDWVLLSN